jgi:NTE family protein
MAKAKLAVALGGGAARGWAHIGVLKALVKAGLEPDVVVGTSIGAVVGGCYVAGKLDELEQFALSLTRRKVFGFLDFNLSGSGLISGERLCDAFDAHLEGVMIEQLDRRFVAVATELGSGHEMWLTRGRLVDAMRASYALPGIFRPVELAGRWLMDGALVNPIPVSVARAMGARHVIAINLNGDAFGRGATLLPDELGANDPEPEADPTTYANGQGRLNGRSAWKLLHRQFFGRGRDEPGISTVMMDAFNIIQDRIARARLMGDPPDFMITPRLGGFGLFEFHRAGELVPLGAEATERELADIARNVRRATGNGARALAPAAI